MGSDSRPLFQILIRDWLRAGRGFFVRGPGLLGAADVAGDDRDLRASDEHADAWYEMSHGAAARAGAFREDEEAVVVGGECGAEADE